jgi:hypothetical protein
VPGLVNGKFRAVWKADRRQESPALIGDVPRYFGSLVFQFGESGVDVVAHQVELVMALPIGWMYSELGRRQGKDKPATARVCRRHAEHIREERTDLLGFWRKHDRMHPGDHAAILKAMCASMATLTTSGCVMGAMWPAPSISTVVTSGKPLVSSLATSRAEAGDRLPTR